MNDDRNIEPFGDVPDRIELRIGNLKAGAVRLLRVHAGLFEDLETDRAVLHVGLELSGSLLPVSRRHVPERIEAIRKHGEPIRVRRAPDVIHAPLERIAEAAAQVVQHADIQRVHLRDQAADRLRGGSGVTVNIHDRELGFRNRMLFGDERSPGPIVDNCGRGKLGRLTGADAYERGAGRALFTRLNRDAPAPAAPAALPGGSLGRSKRRGQRGRQEHENNASHGQAPPATTLQQDLNDAKPRGERLGLGFGLWATSYWLPAAHTKVCALRGNRLPAYPATGYQLPATSYQLEGFIVGATSLRISRGALCRDPRTSARIGRAWSNRRPAA